VIRQPVQMTVKLLGKGRMLCV